MPKRMENTNRIRYLAKNTNIREVQLKYFYWNSNENLAKCLLIKDYLAISALANLVDEKVKKSVMFPHMLVPSRLNFQMEEEKFLGNSNDAST